MSPAKDRLSDLQKHQKQILNKNEDVQIGEEVLPKELSKLFQYVETVRQDFDAMKGNTNRIIETLDEYKMFPTKELQAKLHSMLNACTTINFTIENKLKNFEKDVSKVKNKNSSEYRMKLLQCASLRQEFRELLDSNNKVIESYRDAFRQQLKASAKVVRNIDDEELEALLDDDKPIQVFIDNILVDTKVARQQLRDIEARHEELLFIESQLKEISDLFKEVAILVEGQQESINRVEYHAQVATDYVEQGAVDIGKGHKKKKQYLKLKIYIIIILSILFTAIIISLFV